MERLGVDLRSPLDEHVIERGVPPVGEAVLELHPGGDERIGEGAARGLDVVPQLQLEVALRLGLELVGPDHRAAVGARLVRPGREERQAERDCDSHSQLPIVPRPHLVPPPMKVLQRRPWQSLQRP